MGNWMLCVPILLPILAGALLPFIKALKGRAARQTYICVTLAVTLAAVFMNLAGEKALSVWSLTDTLTIALKVDDLSRLFSVLLGGMWLVVAVFAFQYMKHEKDEERFFAFYLIVIGMLEGLCYAANLVTMYLCFEMMTLTSLPLVLHSLTKDAIQAGLKYLFYSIAGAFMALLGIFFFSAYGSAGFAAGGVLDAARLAGHEGTMYWILFLTIVGFGTKAGMFPMHGWLPTAHPIAPAPASAVLSGVITKAGVFCIARTVFYVVGADLVRGTWVQTAWIVLALITVFMGSMMAYKEPVLKKRLAYSSVSQLSYVLLGLAVLTQDGLIGGLTHVVFHSIIKDGLFLVAGAIIFSTGITKVDELRGIGRQMPVTMWCYTLLALALTGIPPLSGFVSKWYLAMGCLNSGLGALTWIGPVVLLVSALLTAGYLLPLSIRGFFPGRDYVLTDVREPSPLMTVPMIVLTALTVWLGLFPTALISFVEGIAKLVL